MVSLLRFVPATAKIALLAAVVAAAGVLSWQYDNLKSSRDTALAEVGALRVAKDIQDATIDTQRDAIDQWKQQAENFQVTLQAMAIAQLAASEESRRLNDVLSKHDLTRLSLAKPGLIENRINSGTANIIELLRCAAGHRCDDDNGSDKPTPR